MSAKVCSATLTAFEPGVFITRMPRRVQASTSMLSTPAPARPTTRRRGAEAISSAVTRVALRTMSASASARAERSSPEVGASTCQPERARSSMPRGEILSATTTRMALKL